jgi:hypothetical protein
MTFGLILPLVITSLTLSLPAVAEPLGAEKRACVFKNPVTFGASITAETAMLLPGYHTLMSARALARGIFYLPNFGVSPTHILLGSYAHKLPFEMGLNISKFSTNSGFDFGASQVFEMLRGKYKDEFDKASIVMSVDAFYWDAIANECGYGRYAGAEDVIEVLISTAHAQNKALILGNVPHEDPSKVLIDSKTLGIPGLWYNPVPACVTSINETLERLCTVENGCYLVDMASWVAILNGGGTLPLNGKQYGLYWIRPDGVHLSMYGSELVYQKIVEALETHPPSCEEK